MEKIYEFKVLSILDERGSCNVEKLMTELNFYGLTGWHVVGAFSNSLGENSLMINGIGVNSNVDENIIILQREKEISEKDLRKSKELHRLENEVEEYSESICENCGNYIKPTDKKCPICKTKNPNFGLIL